MRSRRFTHFSFFIIFCISGAQRSPAAQVPTPVSPGAVERLASVGSVCPTFSWGSVDPAHSYELVVYAVTASGEDGGTVSSDREPRLRHRLPGSATSWTPSLDACFEPGGRYAWAVRAISSDEEGAWSEARLFQVAAGPTRQELADALASVERYLADGDGSASTSSQDVTEYAPESAKAAGKSPVATGIDPVPAAATLAGAFAAIRGELSDTTGEAVGVLGVSNSLGGAGILAANTDSTGVGADLVLDGSAQGLPDTTLTESGIQVGGATFEIGSSTGSLNLTLDGFSIVTTSTDQDALNNLGCIPGEVAKWDGAIWSCATDDDTEVIAGNQLALTGTTLDVEEGTGSGLDADLLDGQEASAFAPATHPHAGEDVTSGIVAEPRIDPLMARDAEIVPTVLANDGSGSTLDADLLDGQEAGDFAGSVHDHYGGTWNGTAVRGLTIETNHAVGGARGVLGVYSGLGIGNAGVGGRATATSGEIYGVRGESLSSSGRGVFGLASESSGIAIGVEGQSFSTSGRGVFGRAITTFGTTYGVYGQSASQEGRGVFGEALATVGAAYGVHGMSASNSGLGVFGEAVATSGTTYGV